MHLSADQSASLDRARDYWARFGDRNVDVDVGASEIQLSFQLRDADRLLNRLSRAEKFRIGEYICQSVENGNTPWCEQVLTNRAGIVSAYAARLTLDQCNEIGIKLLESAMAGE